MITEISAENGRYSFPVCLRFWRILADFALSRIQAALELAIEEGRGPRAIRTLEELLGIASEV
jgi:hypothetical protein